MIRENTRQSYTEFIIIAVVLGAAAVGAVPRFTEVNPESRVGELIEGVQKMQIRLDLYRAKHCGCIPDVSSFVFFQSAMTAKVGRCGPQVGKIPANLFSNLNTVRFEGEPAGTGMTDWRLDSETGLFRADDIVPHAGLRHGKVNVGAQKDDIMNE